ncbi:hypothetical protein M406DRAFT_328855 [Cryphonectria parasitica EP155]|uniref:Uncharacterized protein n=1 Tax=Cryphonectria parasitica (strain ATCC 38755 / EP155) TaxID=660469 RepID=A0A9P4Y7B2_CRYP1|nr:uncharacterized protein M406DRAFT_328855 [Cryphonectria parasitica EP155]KAF3767800.1 hypothetical protein M406DRAFT_328855 [Cryphonectria parasitica EP155]
MADKFPHHTAAEQHSLSHTQFKNLEHKYDSLNYLGIMTSVGCREMPLGGTRLSSFGSLEPFDPSESASVEKFRMRGEDVLNLRWQLDPGYVWSITSGDLAIAKSMGLEAGKD